MGESFQQSKRAWIPGRTLIQATANGSKQNQENLRRPDRAVVQPEDAKELLEWLHQVCDGASGVCHGTDAANIRHVVRRHDDASAQQGGLPGAFLNVLHGHIGMPVRPFARGTGCRVHHSGHILPMLLKQRVGTEWPCIHFLA
jgi:hypothetical protein